jgi:DNA-directed RNA polymerase specialized sigma subunit
MTKTRTNRVVTNEEMKKYDGLVEAWLSKAVLKNFKEANLSESSANISLGNTGLTMDDLRQYARTEVLVALKNFDPSKGAKESTYVYLCLSSRFGMLMKKLVKKSKGYGVFTCNIEQVLGEDDGEEC